MQSGATLLGQLDVLTLVAIVYGVISGTASGGGMILGPFLLGAGIVGQGLVDLIAALGLTLNITKTLVFLAGELLNREMISLGVCGFGASCN